MDFSALSETQQQLIVAFALGVFGLSLGSFLNVVAYRLPRGQTPAKPKRSHCPSCDAEIRARDNVPVFSWLLLRGRCRDCGATISWRYPFFEALTAVLFAAVGWRDGLELVLLPDLLLVTTLIVVTNTDLDLRIVPNKVLFVSLIAGLLAQSVARPDEWFEWSLVGDRCLCRVVCSRARLSEGHGHGRREAAGVMGLYLGRAVAPSLMIAFLLGTLVGVGVMVKKGVAEGRKTAVPFVPFMAIGGIFGLFWGDAIIEWYLDTFANSA